jgi:membrane associated rhomboid family serine protease
VQHVEQGALKTPIWTKSFNINFLTNFLVYLCMYLLIVIIASYTKSEYHASDSIAGLVSGLFYYWIPHR